MRSKMEAIEKIKSLKNGEHCYFNTHQDGGAVCYKCNGVFLLFEVPLYGGRDQYEGTYFEDEIEDFVDTAFDWA